MLKLALIAALTCAASASVGKLHVFILTGQSNMEGHGVATLEAGANDGNGTLEWQLNVSHDALPVCETMAEPPREGCRAEGASFDGLKDADGNWTVFESVTSVFRGSTNKTGPLSIGFGFQDSWIGPEYGFGIALADKLGEDERVLLLKWAWGGTSLDGDWRPPSTVAADGGVVGWCYGNMTQTVHEILEHELDGIVDGYDYATDSYAIEGFAWHQGWNDGCDDEAYRYEFNLENLIADVRAEFDKPSLPVAIGLSGFDGYGQAIDRRLEVMRAQYNVTTHVPFVGTVETRGFFRDFAETNGSINQGYHWFGNGETYYYLGTAMGRAMGALLDGAWTQPYINTTVPPAPNSTARLASCGVYEDGSPCAY